MKNFAISRAFFPCVHPDSTVFAKVTQNFFLQLDTRRGLASQLFRSAWMRSGRPPHKGNSGVSAHFRQKGDVHHHHQRVTAISLVNLLWPALGHEELRSVNFSHP